MGGYDSYVCEQIRMRRVKKTSWTGHNSVMGGYDSYVRGRNSVMGGYDSYVRERSRKHRGPAMAVTLSPIPSTPPINVEKEQVGSANNSLDNILFYDENDDDGLGDDIFFNCKASVLARELIRAAPKPYVGCIPRSV
ncbi:hypothetical protein C2G38_2184132 [Gigaspora rosea]|uniref:Uncharacterized protein n=1 Tax=Gigaspora rosea TaxID=44941 RepID=A0A397VH37_9GLOM|nr:hypothetical protein C2G38_2184132 [Gigaspora rosea]